jgi:hypothetical protein
MLIQKRQALRLAGAALLASMVSGVAYAADQAANALSPGERKEGWRLLFNGKNLDGWRGYRKTTAPSQWAIEDGALTLTKGGGGDLITKEEFGDFDLMFEWKISPKGNSGLIYHIKEGDDLAQTYFTGPEMQVLDNDGHADGKIPTHRAGALYDFVEPPANITRPVGEWNSARVVVRKGRLQHWLNGVKTVDLSYGDDAWRAAVAKTKFKDMPRFGKSLNGHIGLQDHGDRVWYRNIKVRKL